MYFFTPLLLICTTDLCTQSILNIIIGYNFSGSDIKNVLYFYHTNSNSHFFMKIQKIFISINSSVFISIIVLLRISIDKILVWEIKLLALKINTRDRCICLRKLRAHEFVAIFSLLSIGLYKTLLYINLICITFSNFFANATIGYPE